MRVGAAAITVCATRHKEAATMPIPVASFYDRLTSLGTTMELRTANARLADERDFWRGEAMALRARIAFEEAKQGVDEVALNVAARNLSRAEAMRTILPELDQTLDDYLLPQRENGGDRPAWAGGYQLLPIVGKID